MTGQSTGAEAAQALQVCTVVVVALMIASCANVQRSRDTADARVPPAVIAVQVCAFCHGADGNAISPNFPRLAGQPKDYLVTQLRNYRSRHRSDPAGYEYMWGLTRSLTDNQIDGLADYFARQVPAPNAPARVAGRSLGKQVYEQGAPERDIPPCAACHGAKGEGQAAFPRLAWQHKNYVIKQLKLFQNTNDRPDTAMTQVTHNLTDHEIESVATYLQDFPATPP